MKKHRTLLTVTFLLNALLCAAAFNHARASDAIIAASTKDADAARRLPFDPEEELVYQAEFSRLLLRGIEIAEFRFNATSSAAAKRAGESDLTRPQLFFKADARAKGWFRKLFGVDFHYRQESLVDPQTFQILHTMKLDEQGKRVRASEAVFDTRAGQVTWTERDPNDPTRPPRVVTNQLGGAAYDIISAIYFLRTRPLSPGQNFELSVSDSGETYRVPVKVVRRETLKTIVGRVPALRVEVGLFGENGLVNDRRGEMSLWITDDSRRLPVRARLSADVGTLEIKLKEVSGGSLARAGAHK